MKIETINGIIKLTAENGKCLILKGKEQTIEDNEITEIYLAKSLKPEDFEEKELMEVENGNS